MSTFIGNPLEDSIKAMLDKLHTLWVEQRITIPEEHAYARTQCQPVDLPTRLAALEKQQQAKRLAFDEQHDVKRSTLEKQQQAKRLACGNKHRAALNKLFPPALREQVEALQEAQEAELAALEEAQEAALEALDNERAKALEALDNARAKALETLVPHDVAERQAAIDREFAARQADVAAASLRQEMAIRAATKDYASSVRGTYLQAIYKQGRRSWDSDGLLRLAQRIPEVSSYMKMGEPSIAIRAVAQLRPPTRILYDIHG